VLYGVSDSSADQDAKKVLEFVRSKKYDKKVQLVKTVPGIGTLIAIEMLVELQDVSRFRSINKFSAYIELTLQNIPLERITSEENCKMRKYKSEGVFSRGQLAI